MLYSTKIHKNIYLSLLLLIVVCHVANAAVGIFVAKIHSDRHQCEFENKFYAMGTTPQKDYCGQINCSKDCKCEILTCGTVAVDSHCYIERALDKPYPDCCPVGVCPDGDEINVL